MVSAHNNQILFIFKKAFILKFIQNLRAYEKIKTKHNIKSYRPI